MNLMKLHVVKRSFRKLLVSFLGKTFENDKCLMFRDNGTIVWPEGNDLTGINRSVVGRCPAIIS